MNSPLSRIHWLDNIRVIACVLVIISHVVGQFYVSPPFSAESADFQNSSVYTVLVRMAIPLFLMISGALLLPALGSTGTFLKKRFARILVPFLLWSVLYTVFPWCYETLTGDSFKSIFPLSRATSDIAALGKNLLLIPLKFNVGIHLWYLYVLMGLYLFVPIISPWVAKARKSDFIYFLILWSITLFFPYIQRVFPDILGKCSWNDYGALHAFSGYLGYMILGSFLRKHYKTGFLKTIVWALPCFIVGFWFTLHFYRTSTIAAGSSSGLFIGFSSWNVALMGLALFVLFQTCPAFLSQGRVQQALSEFSQMSFGIYLAHFVLTGMVYQLFLKTGLFILPPWISLPLLSLAICLVSYLVVKSLSYLPKSKYLIG